MTKGREKFLALKAAFPLTIPVLTGFIFLGIAYGILMNSKGYGLLLTAVMSIIVYAGAAQYVAVTFLTTVFDPFSAFVMTLLINARHMFYGISLLETFKDTGRVKPYLIFGLTDETFSIICSSKIPEDIDASWFYFFVTLLNHFYWVLGSLIGVIIGNTIMFDTRGLDFVLTALFTTIFVSQWKKATNHKPAIIGVLCSVISLIVFGKSAFTVPAMGLIVLVLLTLKSRIEDKW